MGSYTVKQIADMLNTNEETVRRWIRSGKLDATWVSKKSGNVISSAALSEFIEKTPKYASVVTNAHSTSPIAMSVILGSLLGGMLTLINSKKSIPVTSSDIEEFLKKKISSHEKVLQSKKVKIEKLQKEITIEQQEVDKYRYALEHLDLQLLADEINNGNK